MATVKKKIILSEEDLKELVAEKYGLDKRSCSVTVYKPTPSHDPRENGQASITIEGQEK